MAGRSRPDSYTMRRILATVLCLAERLDRAGKDSQGRPYAECVACGVRATVGLGAADPDRFELGHVIAHSAGGSFKPDNVVPLCRACNIRMGSETMTDLLTLRYDTRPLWDGVLLDDPGAPKPHPVREWWPVGACKACGTLACTGHGYGEREYHWHPREERFIRDERLSA